ncbi:hypothetical protein RHMOL_Rhmol11G0032300 [Rhododendron molle]|uniref:Uncharacterized protein n=1 Tax=Rhododendron molle TaxID=49168 RepID=A0ACC0LN36_RHOML|nr:hypothetical protein RHMOL_Rhmol11G0032300 [Rhododendron molle]
MRSISWRSPPTSFKQARSKPLHKKASLERNTNNASSRKVNEGTLPKPMENHQPAHDAFDDMLTPQQGGIA